MCLYINTNLHQKKSGYYSAKVADRPLVVKKIVHNIDGQYLSPYQDVSISTNIIYEEPKFRSKVTNKVVEYGHHSFHTEITTPILKNMARFRLLTKNCKTIYGVIPVGAKYFIGDRHDIVSNKITYYNTLEEIRLLQYPRGNSTSIWL